MVVWNEDETDEDSEGIEDEHIKLSIDDIDAPLKAQSAIRNAFGGKIDKSRVVRSGPASTHMPDFLKMTSTGKSGRRQDTLRKPHGTDFDSDPFGESYSNTIAPKLTLGLVKTLNNMSNKIGINNRVILSEDKTEEIEDQNGEA